MHDLGSLQHELQARRAAVGQRVARTQRLRALTPEATWATWAIVALGWLSAPALAGPIGATATWIGLALASAVALAGAAALWSVRRPVEPEWARVVEASALVDGLACWLPPETTARLDESDPAWLRLTLRLEVGDLRCGLPWIGVGEMRCALYGEGVADARARLEAEGGEGVSQAAGEGEESVSWGAPIPESMIGDPTAPAWLVGQALERVDPGLRSARLGAVRRWPLDPLAPPRDVAPIRADVWVGLGAASSCGALAAGAFVGGWWWGGALAACAGALALVGASLRSRVAPGVAGMPPAPTYLEVSRAGVELEGRGLVRPASWGVDLPAGEQGGVEAAVLIVDEGLTMALTASLMRDELPNGLPEATGARPGLVVGVTPSAWMDVVDTLREEA